VLVFSDLELLTAKFTLELVISVMSSVTALARLSDDFRSVLDDRRTLSAVLGFVGGGLGYMVPEMSPGVIFGEGGTPNGWGVVFETLKK